MKQIVYRFHNALYINLTNRCPNSCVFCIKTKFAMRFDKYDLNLFGQEPSSEEIIVALQKEMALEPVKEIVFCGYGEPTMRLKTLLETAEKIKQLYPQIKLRLNTVGLGSLVNGRDISSDLAKNIDEVSISLNSPNEQEWQKIVRPNPQYAAQGYQAMLDFVRACAPKMNTVVSIVDKQNINVEKAKILAQSLGAKLRVREFIDEM
jgi:radical SAM protein, TatD family-associated